MVTATAPPPVQGNSAPALDHLSWSGIKTYTTCPKKFHFHYIEKAPKEFVAAALTFGSAFHVALDGVHQALMEGAAIPAIDALLAKYDESWKAETEKAPEVVFAKTEDAGILRKTAQRMLDAYCHYIAVSGIGENGAQIIGIEHAHRFRLLADVPPLEMRLDLMELVNGDLVVTDVKTARSKWNEQKTIEGLPQLVLYANGLVPLVKELGAKKIVPRFVVVSKGKTPVVQVLEPNPTQDDVIRLKKHVADTWAAIQAGVFIQREGWHCNQCPYRKRCLGR
jgi:hypothetical protein